MRTIVLSLAILLASPALAAEGAAVPAGLPAGAADCLECHKAGGDGPAVSHLDAFAASVHGQNNVGCTDCHQGYAMGPHDGEGTLSPADAATVARLAKAEWGEGKAKVKLS